jgi:hypothetical protein
MNREPKEGKQNMVISYQSSEGHTTLTDLSDAEVEKKFRELTRLGFRGFARIDLADPVGPVKSVREVRDLGSEEIYMIAPLAGG